MSTFYYPLWGIIFDFLYFPEMGTYNIINGRIEVMFAKKLKKLRNELHLTQKELADKLNMQNTAISKYELGERKPDIDTLNLIADFFHCSIDYLIGKTDDPSPYTKENNEVSIEEDPEAYLENFIKSHPQLRDIALSFKNKDILDQEDVKAIIDYIQGRFLVKEKNKNDI